MNSRISPAYRKCFILIYIVLITLIPAAAGNEADWPQWRHDAGHTAATAHELHFPLYVQWIRKLPVPQPAWPKSQLKLQFDVSYEPVAAGDLIFVPSMVTDSVTAYNTETGKEEWCYYTSGPVRFAPCVNNGKLYAGSDDGYLYCLNAKTGELIWRMRGGPSGHKIIGNGRMIGMWPVRGAPVLYDGIVYFSAGMWPFMGIFIHAVNAETGKVIWTNSGSGAEWTLQQHNSPAFGSIAPQGYCAAAEDILLVPGGRTVPAAYDRKTGKFLYFHVSSRQLGKDSGGYDVTVCKDRFFNRGKLYDLKSGKGILAFEVPGIYTQDKGYYAQYEQFAVARIPSYDIEEILADNEFKRLWLDDVFWIPLSPAPEYVFAKAGRHIFCGRQDGTILAVEPKGGTRASVAWQGKVKGHPWSAVPAQGKLFVITREGALICFGSEKQEPHRYGLTPSHTKPDDEWGQKAEELLTKAGIQEGYALILGATSGRLVEELYRRSRLNLVAVAPTEKERQTLQKKLNSLLDPVPKPPAPKLTGVQWPKEWQVIGPFTKDSEELSVDVLKRVQKSYSIQGKKYKPKPLKPIGRMLDFSLLFGGYGLKTPKPGEKHSARQARKVEKDVDSAGRIAYAFGVINCPKACTIRIGAGADWWMKWFVDGKPVYSTMRRGNTVYPYEADNHIFSVKLSAGRHVITALAKAGGESWTLFSLGGDDLTEWLHKMHKPYAPPRRLSILSGDWDTLMLPPYFASLITAEDLSASGLVNKKGSLKEIFRMLRPYGGMACIPVPEDKISDIKGWKQVLHAELAEFTLTDIDFSIKRKGAPKGSAEWTHQYADSANSVISKDKRVKLPLGLLWFGGPSNDAILPRHGHGPSPQVAGGRLFIEGENLLRALDVYTGRLLWEKNMPGIGWYYRHTDHHPGANEIGSNYVSLADGVYLMSPRSCMMLDPATGNTLKEFSLPARKGPKPARWGSIRIWKDLLIATASPLSVYPLEWLKERGKAKKPVKAEIRQVPIVEQNADYGSASETLVVMNRKSGKILWTRSARYGFRHNAVVAAAGTVFCIDTISKGKLSYLKRRGFKVQTKPVLYALNARTGDAVWESKSNIFGTWLGYSEEHDILLQAGSKGRDRARDEVGQGLAAYKGKDGTLLWQYNEPYTGPCLIYHDMIIIQNRALSLTTGKPLVRKNPVTGTDIPWKFLRTYGCNTVIGSEHLLTFRSAAAGYFDLKDLSGTGNLGGFKSGCTSNLIAADGVLSAPEYTRTCICSYQNQTSLAMIHMPEAEVWTFNDIKWDGTRVKRLGLNFGAPGDRLSDRGTLWLDSPSTGGYSPDVPVDVQGENAQYFRHHASYVKKGDLPWVTASGLTGADSINITLAEQPKTSQAYTIRLYFADFVNSAAGKRVFDVSIQGKKVLPGFDIIKSAGGAGQGIMKEYKGINVNDQLTIVFKASEGEALVCGVEIIAE